MCSMSFGDDVRLAVRGHEDRVDGQFAVGDTRDETDGQRTDARIALSLATVAAATCRRRTTTNLNATPNEEQSTFTTSSAISKVIGQSTIAAMTQRAGRADQRDPLPPHPPGCAPSVPASGRRDRTAASCDQLVLAREQDGLVDVPVGGGGEAHGRDLEAGADARRIERVVGALRRCHPAASVASLRWCGTQCSRSSVSDPIWRTSVVVGRRLDQVDERQAPRLRERREDVAARHAELGLQRPCPSRRALFGAALQAFGESCSRVIAPRATSASPSRAPGARL